MCVDFAEIEMPRWLLDRGAPVDARAEVDAEGFGGHTALFGCAMSQTVRCGMQDEVVQIARLLLERGADRGARASLRKRLLFTDDGAMHEYREITPLSLRERFHDRAWVSRAVLELLAGAWGLGDALRYNEVGGPLGSKGRDRVGGSPA